MTKQHGNFHLQFTLIITSKLQIAKRMAPLLPINQSTSIPTVLISPRMISVKHVRASIDSSIYHAILGGDSPLPTATYIHIYLVQIWGCSFFMCASQVLAENNKLIGYFRF